MDQADKRNMGQEGIDGKEEKEDESACVTSQIIGDDATAIKNARDGWKFQVPRSRDMQRSESYTCPLRSRAESGLLHCHTMCKMIKRGNTGITGVPVAPMQDPPLRLGRDVEEASP
jgi:hypothetical protein